MSGEERGGPYFVGGGGPLYWITRKDHDRTTCGSDVLQASILAADMNHLHARAEAAEQERDKLREELDELQARHDALVVAGRAVIGIADRTGAVLDIEDEMQGLRDALPAVEPVLPACVHCGSNDVAVDSDESSAWLHCNACSAEGPMKGTADEAIAAYGRANRESQS